MEEFICPDGLGNHFPFLIQKNLAAIETAFGLEISLRGNKIMFSGNGAQAQEIQEIPAAPGPAHRRRTAGCRTTTSNSA